MRWARTTAVGEAAGGAEALAAVEQLYPALVISARGAWSVVARSHADVTGWPSGPDTVAPSTMRSDLQRVGPPAVVTAAVVLCSITVAVTLSGADGEAPWAEAAARALMVGAPLGVGAYALRRPPFARFGVLLVAAGFAWFLTTLAGSDDPLVYSIGRVAGWLGEPLLVALMLTFPTGRLETRVDRLLVGILAVLVATLFLPTALLVDQYPVPVPWTSCDDACPHNALMVASTEPAVIEDLIRPLRELLTIVVLTAVTVRLALRLHAATRLRRRVLAPVLAVACLHYGVYAVALVLRRAGADSEALEVAAWGIALTFPLTAFAFLVGLARWWVFIAVSTRRLAGQLRAHPTPHDLRGALATAFDDPGLQVLYWIENGRGRWADEAGRRAEPPAPGSGRCLTEVRDGDRLVAGIVHDEALRDDRAFIDSATSYALIALDNQRLTAQTTALLDEVRRSRARIQAAADEERRRIERDLHDGAQQRLVALRIKLELAAERAGEDDGDGDGAASLRALGADVDEALEEVRSLARGIYPAPLADRGLVEGLRAAAMSCALPATVLAAGVGRYPRAIESAAYFCCLEALQNAAKHATGATAAVVDLSDDGDLRFEVRDDGAGFDPAVVDGGVGFTSMRDRLEAVGGEVAIESRPGHGTRVTARIPLNGGF